MISATETEALLQTEAVRERLSPENGAVEITEDLIKLGRDTFYRENFGNEVLFTDIVGIIDGPLNVAKLAKAVLALKGQPTNNLQVTLDEDVTFGDRTFKAGTVLNMGLDVAKGSLFPLELITRPLANWFFCTSHQDRKNRKIRTSQFFKRPDDELHHSANSL